MPFGKARSIQAQPAGSIDPVSRHFEAIFLEHWPRLCSLLTSLVGDRDEAEDLALETFLRLYQRPPARDDNLSGWLARVATHLGLNFLRSRKRRQQYEQEAVRQEHIIQPGSTPAELFAAEEDRRRVREVLSQMNTRQAQLLILRHSGRSYRQIATALELAETSIGPLLVRAEAEFERRYKDLEAGNL